jgi:hypothetical protein
MLLQRAGPTGIADPSRRVNLLLFGDGERPDRMARTTQRERTRKLLPYYILIILSACFFFAWGWPSFTAFVQKQRPEAAILIYLALLGSLALPGLLLGVYGLRKARRITATGQVPQRMKELLKGSRLDEHALARRTGGLVYFMSLLLIICSIASVCLCFMLYRNFEATLHRSFSSPRATAGERLYSPANGFLGRTNGRSPGRAPVRGKNYAG